MNRTTQIKYNKYLQENFSQKVIKSVPITPSTANPMKTPKKAVTAIVTIFITGDSESSIPENELSNPETTFANPPIESESWSIAPETEEN